MCRSIVTLSPHISGRNKYEILTLLKVLSCKDLYVHNYIIHLFWCSGKQSDTRASCLKWVWKESCLNRENVTFMTHKIKVLLWGISTCDKLTVIWLLSMHFKIITFINKVFIDMIYKKRVLTTCRKPTGKKTGGDRF